MVGRCAGVVPRWARGGQGKKTDRDRQRRERLSADVRRLPRYRMGLPRHWIPNPVVHLWNQQVSRGGDAAGDAKGAHRAFALQGATPYGGVIARFQVVGYPFGNLPQTFRPPQSREEGASVTPERFRVATTANQASDPSPHRTHTGTAQVIPRLYARIARSGLMGVTPAMSRIRRSRCMGVPPQWHPRRTEEHPRSA